MRVAPEYWGRRELGREAATAVRDYSLEPCRLEECVLQRMATVSVAPAFGGGVE